MSWQSRSRLLAAALAATVTVPAVTGLALAVPAAAGPASARPAAGRTFLDIWGADRGKILGPRAGKGNARIPVPFPIPARTVRSGQIGCASGYVLTTAGQILAWGDNRIGQLGIGTQRPAETPTPRLVRLQPGARAVSVRPGCDHVVALLSTGKVVAWGRNTEGELGDGDPNTPLELSPVPVALPANVRFAAVCAGFDFSLALSTSGRVYAWGDNTHGQSGDGSQMVEHSTPVPVKLSSRTQVTAIACGSDHALALTSAGRVLAWGEGDQGALGTGAPLGISRVPVSVRLPASVRIRALFAGTFSSMALSTTGQVWTWGDNADGQLGNGSTTDHSPRPVLVRLPARTTVRQISGGERTDLVLTARGTILTWGANEVGQLGAGRASTRSRVPVAVHLPRGQAALAAFGGPIADDTLAITRTRH